ncbi:hypothetical protein INT44_000279 [Umbelopsis vinacea]|uniref:Plasmid pRiA4b Orf3-like domain-containing protein n=1 Tax=Umbelopsis vinacea TaxID=44442 RepID=A0A8H7PM92_9FUNG|nr:hypothetical protein INT44_000279 [Umbelopsis vinacea]
MYSQDQPLMLLHAKYQLDDDVTHSDIWRSVIVPAHFTLFQLHIVLHEVFQLIESEDTVHSFRPAKPIYPEHNFTYFQPVSPEKVTQGWMKEIAHGVYIDRSLCSGSSDASLVRIVRDDRVYRLDDHFFVSPLLVYGFEGAHTPRQEILVECKHIFTSARSTSTPRVVAGAGHITKQSTEGNQVDIEMLQVAFKKSHQWHGDVCSVCTRYHHRTCQSQHCLKMDRGRAQSEEDVHEAWWFNRHTSTDDLPSLLIPSRGPCNFTAHGERLRHAFIA